MELYSAQCIIFDFESITFLHRNGFGVDYKFSQTESLNPQTIHDLEGLQNCVSGGDSNDYMFLFSGFFVLGCYYES